LSRIETRERRRDRRPRDRQRPGGRDGFVCPGGCRARGAGSAASRRAPAGSRIR